MDFIIENRADFIIENTAIDGAVIKADNIFVVPKNSSINSCVLCITHIYVTNKP